MTYDNNYFKEINKEETKQAERLADILCKLYSPKSLTDLGCATGLYMKPFWDKGVSVIGYDISEVDDEIRQVPKEQIILSDLTQRQEIQKSDLALCLETGEHLSNEFSKQFVENITKGSDKIIFSAAQVGQGGTDHINCQPKEYWADLFKEYGLVRNLHEEGVIIDALKQGYHLGWLVNNLMVFEKPQELTKMRFHVVGLPHTEVTKEFLPCAYSQKVLNFCKMMTSLGHEVFLYAGGAKADVDCKFISIVSSEEQKQFFGHTDWRKDFFPIEWKSDLPYWQVANGHAIAEISKRILPRDFICLIGGNCQKPITDAFPKHMSVEFGVGYEGVFSAYKVFESYAWMHHVYGLQKQGNGQNYDCVIPNYFDLKDFPFSYKKDDYFLFVGRLISRKGANIVADVVRITGDKLIMAGQGVISNEKGKIVSKEITISGDNIEHVGTVDLKQRGELMSKARAVFVPTNYIGPFEGVHVEAMLCGTPVITTDWGVFSETVEDGIQGFRCRTLGEFIWATKQVDKLNYPSIRDYAIERFSIDKVKYRYQDYFEQLIGLWGKGWYKTDYQPFKRLGGFK